VEINEITYRSAGYSIEDVGSFFKKMNYKAFSIAKGGTLDVCEKLPSFGNIVFEPQ
jgi:hypothetical protein